MIDLWSDGALWLGGALLLALAELIVPGVFLIFVAAAAAITGATLLAFPDLSLPLQLGSFAVWSAVAVLIGRQFYGEPREGASDAMLNDRTARLVGAVVTVSEPIGATGGRVALGDSVWLARGTALAAGAQARVIDVEGAVLIVEGA